jgi:hypothetical protein
VKIKGNKKKMMSAHTFEIFEKKNKNELYKQNKRKRKIRKSKEKGGKT